LEMKYGWLLLLALVPLQIRLVVVGAAATPSSVSSSTAVDVEARCQQAGHTLLASPKQRGLASRCTSLYLWGLQGSGSTFAWQVLKAVTKRRQERQEGDGDADTGGRGVRSSNASATPVHKGHYLLRMAKDHGLHLPPDFQMLSHLKKPAAAGTASSLTSTQADRTGLACLAATYRDFRDVLCSHARRGGVGKVGECKACSASELETKKAVVHMLGALFGAGGGQAKELMKLEERGVLLLRYESFVGCPLLLVDTFQEWLGVEGTDGRLLQEEAKHSKRASAVGRHHGNSSSLGSSGDDGSGDGGSGDDDSGESVELRKLKPLGVSGSSSGAANLGAANSFNTPSTAAATPWLRESLPAATVGGLREEAEATASGAQRRRTSSGQVATRRDTRSVDDGGDEGKWRGQVARDTSMESNDKRAQALKVFGRYSSETGIHGHHISNGGQVGGFEACMTPNVRRHVEASLGPYLSHFNYSIEL